MYDHTLIEQLKYGRPKQRLPLFSYLLPWWCCKVAAEGAGAPWLVLQSLLLMRLVMSIWTDWQVDGFKGWGQNPSCLPRLQVILLSGKKQKKSHG